MEKKRNIKKWVWFCNTVVGKIGIAEDGIGITDLFLDDHKRSEGMLEAKTPLLAQAARELEEYFDGKRQHFDIRLNLQGTSFQIAVWEALLCIPYGETRSYKQVAEMIGNPKACRAVGMANNRNPIMIIVPCHRVIGANGSLTGYGGGLDVKECLLKLEGIRIEK